MSAAAQPCIPPYPIVRAVQALPFRNFRVDDVLRSLDVAKACGFNFVRMSVDWNTVSGATPGAARNYVEVDDILDRLNQNGLGLILVLTGNVTKSGWGSLPAWGLFNSTDRANHVSLYTDLAAHVEANLAGALILQLGNEDANPSFGANGGVGYTYNIIKVDQSGSDPAVVTTGTHTLENGDWVSLVGVLGNENLNGVFQVSNVTSTTFEIPVTTGGNSTGTGSMTKQATVPQWRHDLYADLVPALKTATDAPLALSQYYLVGTIVNDVPQLSDINARNLDVAAHPYLEDIDIFGISLYLDHYMRPVFGGMGVLEAVRTAYAAIQARFDAVVEGTALEAKKLAVFETGLNMRQGGMRTDLSTSATIQNSASRHDLGGHSNLLRESRFFTLRGLWDNGCVTGLSPLLAHHGLVVFYNAMNDLEDHDRRSHPQHYGLANSEGQIYRSAELIARLNQVENLDYGTPGVAPEPPLTST